MAENSGSKGSQAVTLNVNESEANRNIPSSSTSKTSSNGGGFCVSVPFMQKSLKDAANQGSIDALYTLIRTDPNILDKIEGIPFVDTPLHIAVFAGHTRFAMEIMRLKPSFSRKCNEDGFTPVHLALQNNQTQLVYRLVAVDKDLVRVQGREGMTPLHYVVQTGNLDLLAKFLKICPTSIQDVTIRGETVFHIALNNNHLDSFECLIRWMQWTMIEDALLLEETLLNWKDEDGNTVLHIAVSNNQPQVVRWLLDAGVRKNRKNLRGLTALGILQEQTRIDNNEMKAMLVRAGASKGSLPRVKSYEAFLKSHQRGPISAIYRNLMMTLQRNMTNELRSMLLVVVVLFVTATYQTAISPPRGFWQDNYNPSTDQFNSTFPTNFTSHELNPDPHKHEAGKVIMNTAQFYLFNGTNLFCFVLSALIIFFLLPSNFISRLCFSPMIFLYLSYAISLSITKPYGP